MSTTPIDRLELGKAHLLVIDIQERLLPKIHEYEQVVQQSELIIRAARALDLPITVSEQYPKGLGRTHPTLLEAAEGAARVEKMTFSYCADETCRQRITDVGRLQILLIGIETHVCVQQTALDLLRMQMQPVILADAVSSRRPHDREIALHRMRAAGAIVTTVESALFELVHESGTDRFKKILPLVR